MKISRNNSLKIKLSDTEVKHLKSLMEKLGHERSRIGFGQVLNNDEKDLIKNLNEKLKG